MALKENDFVELDYTGFLKEGNAVFDTTIESVAKANQLKGAFKPVIVCLGKGHLLHGLEKKIIGKELGSYKISLSVDEAFGKKDAKKMNLVPTTNFHKQGINPQPGLPVQIDGMTGIVRAVNGGRTIVDFNHPLSGKEVVYEVKLHKIITDTASKVKSLVKAFIKQDVQVTVDKDDATVSMTQELPKPIADEFSKQIALLAGLKHITFLKA